MTKALWGLSAAFLATIVAARLTFEVTRERAVEPLNEPWAQAKMEFVAWNGEEWTAWIRDGGFEQVPQDTSDWNRLYKSSLAFIDWDGEPWQAKIDGELFLLAHRGDWSAPTETASAIRYRDWSGKPQLRTVAHLTR